MRKVGQYSWLVIFYFFLKGKFRQSLLQFIMWVWDQVEELLHVQEEDTIEILAKKVKWENNISKENDMIIHSTSP